MERQQENKTVLKSYVKEIKPVKFICFYRISKNYFILGNQKKYICQFKKW